MRVEQKNPTEPCLCDLFSAAYCICVYSISGEVDGWRTPIFASQGCSISDSGIRLCITLTFIKSASHFQWPFKLSQTTRGYIRGKKKNLLNVIILLYHFLKRGLWCFSELGTTSSLGLSTRSQHIWLGGTTAIVYTGFSKWCSQASLTDTGIVLAQRYTPQPDKYRQCWPRGDLNLVLVYVVLNWTINQLLVFVESEQ